MQLIEVKYDEQMHEVICAARAASVQAGAPGATFMAAVMDGNPADVDDMRQGRVWNGFFFVADRWRCFLVIDWGGARYMYASEGGLLYRVEGWPEWGSEDCGEEITLKTFELSQAGRK